MMKYVTGLGGVVTVGWMMAASFFGYVPGSHQRTEVPASLRQNPGGYRTWSFWHSGEHGGK
ncbi:MAG: hypothetical protein KBF88_06200 [Polyangiaceae bacterium]|nr:hypothetical protein [Polyangiaceae bacterium]